MPLTTDRLVDNLEHLVDRSSLADVVDALSIVCGAKAAHIRENWQDDKLATVWARCGHQLDQVADRFKTQGLGHARLRFDEAKREASEIRKTALRLIAEFKFADSWSRLDGPLPPTIRKTLCATIQGYRAEMCELYETRASLLADYGQHDAWNH